MKVIHTFGCAEVCLNCSLAAAPANKCHVFKKHEVGPIYGRKTIFSFKGSLVLTTEHFSKCSRTIRYSTTWGLLYNLNSVGLRNSSTCSAKGNVIDCIKQ